MFTKFAVCIPMQNKTSVETRKALIKMLNEFQDEKPEILLTDAGKEFKNGIVKTYLQQQGIKHVIPGNDFKAAVVERVNKIIQRKIYHYLTAHGTDEYAAVLQQIVNGYNNTTHETIQKTPTEAEQPENHLWVRDLLNRHYTDVILKKKKHSQNKFKVGDTVRIAIRKGKFHRSYNEQSQEELFQVIGVDNRMPITMYDIRSWETLEPIIGSFYASELTKVTHREYIIEKIIRRRTYRGERQVLVKWKYYHKSENQWIPEQNVQDAFQR